jgi:hypothetical protein
VAVVFIPPIDADDPQLVSPPLEKRISPQANWRFVE